MNTHSKTIVDLINSTKDKEVQDEMIAIHNRYKQALVGLRLAQEHLKMIDDDCGTDHADILGEINNVIAFVKHSEISLQEMAVEAL